MRDYSKVAPTFWTGETGRILREHGRDAQLVAIYLITCPSANMVGIFDLPIPLICHHLGMTREGALKALRRASEGGFVRLDSPSEGVFVPMMAFHQIGEKLSPSDNRHKALVKELAKLRKSVFIHDFYRIYEKPYHLPPLSPLEAPSKPLRSQEQEQEQDFNTPLPPKAEMVGVEEAKPIEPKPAGMIFGRDREAKQLVRRYAQRVTPAHGFTGIPEVKQLLDAEVSEADLERAIDHFGSWHDREGTAKDKRVSARRFFGEEMWREYVAKIPPPVRGVPEETSEDRARTTREAIERKLAQ